MAISKVVMPKLSEQMETGKIIKWLKQEGDRVQSGDILAEVETDKADVEMEAFGSGVLRKILVPAGGAVPVGALIGVIAEPTEDIASVVSQAGGGSPATPALAAVSPQPRREDPAARTPSPSTGAPDPGRAVAGARVGVGAPAGLPEAEGRSAGAPTPTLAPATATPGGVTRVKASPLARKIAAQSGVDLRLVQGSGPGGRVVRRDVEAASAPGAARPAVAAVSAASVPAGVEFEDRPLSQMRAVIAKRMPLSKAPVPHFYVSSEIAMDRAWTLREELNALEGQPKISVNDFVIRACALALRQHPGVNASFQGEAIRVYHRAHIGIAVALEDGLITPVLRDADTKSISRIAAEARDLAERARTRKLRVPELSGATFSISNLGMFDVTEFSAIINPPEGAILAVGTVRRIPVVTEEGLGVGRRMMLTLSCDHRVMDGAMGARFLQDVKHLLEEPLRLLV
jgi:pyruvate dehydrogenase E2 component (dihydrolipoamide acetyltransferase)